MRISACASVRLFTLQASGTDREEEEKVVVMARRCCLPSATAFQILEIYQRVSCVFACISGCICKHQCSNCTQTVALLVLFFEPSDEIMKYDYFVGKKSQATSH